MSSRYEAHLFKVKSASDSQVKKESRICDTPHQLRYICRWDANEPSVTETSPAEHLEHLKYQCGAEDSILDEDHSDLSFHNNGTYLSYVQIFIHASKKAKSESKWSAVIKASKNACRMIELREIERDVFEQLTSIRDLQPDERCYLMFMELDLEHLSSERLFVKDCDPALLDVKQALRSTAKLGIALRTRSPAVLQDDFSRLAVRFSSETKTNPIYAWEDVLILPSLAFHPRTGSLFKSYFPLRSSFFSWNDYIATMGVGAKIVRETTENDKTQPFTSPLVLIKLEDTENGKFSAIFKVPRKQGENFTPGDKASAYLGKTPVQCLIQESKPSPCFKQKRERLDASDPFPTNVDPSFRQAHHRGHWDMRIVAPMASAPKGTVFATLECRWDETRKRYFDTNQYHVINQENIPAESKIMSLLQQEKVFARIVPEHRHSIFPYVFEALSKFQEFRNHGDDTFAKSGIPQILIANDFEKIEEHDIYKTLSNISLAAEDNFELNESQKAAIRLARAAPGGFVVCHGGPGTGKTHFVVQAVTPFLCDKAKYHHLLLTAAGNPGADSVAEAVGRQLELLKKEGKARPRQYILRLHSIKSEKEIVLCEAEKFRRRNLQARLASKSKSKSKSKMNTTEQLHGTGLGQAGAIFDHCRTFSRCKYDGIHDNRVRLIELSAGQKMLQIAGVQVDGPRAGSGLFAKFVELYDKYREGDAFTFDEWKGFEAQIDALLAYTIKNATAICATVGGAADIVVTDNYSSAELLVVDEAARVPEYQWWPLLAFYPNAIGKIMVGDPHQLRPMVEEDLRKGRRTQDLRNPFKAQLEISLQERLQSAGFKAAFFNEQYRAVPDIAQIYSNACYESLLTNHPSTEIQHRPLAQAIVEHNAKQYGMEKTVLFYDISNAKEHRVNGKPKVCPQYAAVALKILNNLLKAGFGGAEHPCTIAVLTPYKTQETVFQIALSKMEGATNVTLETVDRVQGNEYDICIIDPVCVERPGFLTKNRLNVMFSRARHGLYVVGNHTAWRRMWRSDSLMLRKFGAELAKHKKSWDPTESLESKFFTPGAVEVDDSDDSDYY